MELAEVTGSVDSGERKPESCSPRKGRTPPDPVLSPRPTAGGGALPAPAFPGTLPPT